MAALGEGVDAIPEPALEAFVGQVVRLRDAQRRLCFEGVIVADAKGAPIAHPAVAIELRAQLEIRHWLELWGTRVGAQRSDGGGGGVLAKILSIVPGGPSAAEGAAPSGVG
jgi:hypothetical protein